jgi:hypothetical protein
MCLFASIHVAAESFRFGSGVFANPHAGVISFIGRRQQRHDQQLNSDSDETPPESKMTQWLCFDSLPISAPRLPARQWQRSAARAELRMLMHSAHRLRVSSPGAV